MSSSTFFPVDLRDFVDATEWTFAKTVPEWPHEYIVRERVDDALFVLLARHIRANGYEGKFYQKSMTYYDENGMVYWTMGAPLDETIIVNRSKKEDSYEKRLLNATLAQSGLVSEEGRLNL